MKNFERTESLIGKTMLEKLKNAKVIVYGVGGVGGFVCEALARSAVGQIDIVDFDVVSESNINRQIIATEQTVGKIKTSVLKKRINSINKNCIVNEFCLKIDKDNIDDIDLSVYDFVVDAIDTVTSKVLLIEKAKKQKVDIISCMGTGNKLDVTKLEITNIKKTHTCPLAKIVRKLLKEKQIDDTVVIYSTEQTLQNQIKEANISGKTTLSKIVKKIIDSGDFDNLLKNDEENLKTKQTPSSMIFVPATAGLMIANYIVIKIMEK